MKITIFSLVCLLIASNTTNAQQLSRKVGDAYVKDGIPCTIIDIDESGKKGLIMTMVPKDDVWKKAVKSGDTKWFFVSKKLKGKEKKLCYEYIKEFYSQYKCDTFRIWTSGFSHADRITTSHSGKENMKNVIDFCKDKDISMEKCFPTFAWAQSLGEGWYIPGIDELELYAKFLGYEGIGKQYALGLSDMIQKMKELREQANEMQAQIQTPAEVQVNQVIAAGQMSQEEVEALKKMSLLQQMKFAKQSAEENASVIGYNPFDFIPQASITNVISSTYGTTKPNNKADKGCNYLSCDKIEQKATMKNWIDLACGGGNVCAVCEVEFE